MANRYILAARLDSYTLSAKGPDTAVRRLEVILTKIYTWIRVVRDTGRQSRIAGV